MVFLFTLLLFCLYFRVMGLKLLPPLVLWGFMFFSSFFMLVLFNVIFFGENHLGRIVYAGAKLVFILLSSVECLALLSYSLLFVWSMLFVSMKAFLTVSMIVGNFIDVYILGIVAVLISSLLYLIIFGCIISSLVLFIFLSSLLVFLFILSLLELFSSLFASLTLSNRLSINMLCGSLLLSLLCGFIFATLCFNITLILIYLVFFLAIIFLFECFNSMVQCSIFNILGFEYLLILFNAFFIILKVYIIVWFLWFIWFYFVLFYFVNNSFKLLNIFYYVNVFILSGCFNCFYHKRKSFFVLACFYSFAQSFTQFSTYFFIEFSESLFYSSIYWHFVDIIRLVVFILYFFRNN